MRNLLKYCSRNSCFSTSRRLFQMSLTRCYLHSTEIHVDYLSTKKNIFLFSFHFCFWECSCFLSRFIFWDLNFHYFCLLSRSRSRNRVYETNRLRDCFFQIDTLFLNRVRLIFLISWFLYDWKFCWWRNF